MPKIVPLFVEVDERLKDALEDAARANKRRGFPDRGTISAVVREALAEYLRHRGYLTDDEQAAE